MFAKRHLLFQRLLQIVLLGEAVAGLVFARWSLLVVALAALALIQLPHRFARWFGVVLPPSFLSALALFIFATIYLGEAYDFYHRYWWWDIVLHFGSAVSFGLFGFLFIFMMFEGDRYAAPPLAIAFLSFCFALSIGAVWEVFEFGMDQVFGLNMQKSGLVDTMTDLIVDMLGALLGALSGYLYLLGRSFGGGGRLIDEYIRMNRRLYAKFRKD